MRHVTPDNRVVNSVPPSNPADGLITAAGKRTVQRLLEPCPHLKKSMAVGGCLCNRSPSGRRVKLGRKGPPRAYNALSHGWHECKQWPDRRERAPRGRAARGRPQIAPPRWRADTF